jgi:hypothetical protein
MEVDVGQALVQPRQGLAGAYGPFVEVPEHEGPDRTGAFQRLEHGPPLHPPGGLRKRPGQLRVAPGDVAVPPGQRFLHHGLQPRRFGFGVGIPGVGVADGQGVAVSGALPVGIRDVRPPLTVHADEGEGVVHHRTAVVGAPDEVVGEAHGVSHLVGRVLPPPGGDELLRVQLGVHPQFVIRREKPCVDVEVDQRSVGVHPGHGHDDLPRAGVAHPVPRGGARVRPVGQLDHRVAGVHGVCPFRQILHPEGVPEACRLQGLVPPQRPLPVGRPVRLGEGGIQVVDDGGDRLHQLPPEVGRRVAGDQAPPIHQAHPVVLVEALAVVLDGGGRVGRAGVVRPHREGIIRKLNEGMVLLQRDGAAVRGPAPELHVGVVRSEGQDRAHLRVPGEGAGPLTGHVAPVPVELHRTQVVPPNRPGHSPHVAEHQVRGVHQDPPPRLPHHRQGGQDGGGEGLQRPGHGLVPPRTRDGGIPPDQHHPGARPAEAHHPLTVDRPPVQVEGPGRSQARPQGGEVEEVLLEPLGGDLEKESSRGRVVVQVQEPVLGLHRSRVGGDGIHLLERGRERSALPQKRGGEREQGQNRNEALGEGRSRRSPDGVHRPLVVVSSGPGGGGRASPQGRWKEVRR